MRCKVSAFIPQLRCCTSNVAAMPGTAACLLWRFCVALSKSRQIRTIVTFFLYSNAQPSYIYMSFFIPVYISYISNTHGKSELTLKPGGMNSSLSGFRLLFPPWGPILRPGPGNGPTGSNLAPGGAPIGGRKPSPPQGPRGIPPIPPIPPSPRPNIGWFGPTIMPSPSPPGNRGGGAKGF